MKHPDSITVADIASFAAFDEIIDVRSPAEFALDHMPRAVSYPVLDDSERAEVGTLHKQDSAFAAKVRGAVLVSRRIALHIEHSFASRAKDWRPLVYCWRGGKRSGAMTHVLREIGWQAATLEGGYKTYRREVVAQLASLPARFHFIVVCGETGSAKSRLLEALERRGGQVLDLERLANHRGSVLGEAPDSPQPPQKLFESGVWDALIKLDATRVVFVESESKKVGELHVPDALIAAMRAADCLRIAAPMRARVAFLLSEYEHFVRDRARLDAKLDCLVSLYPKQTLAHWKHLTAAGEWPAFVEDMLINHYDPAYRRSMDRNFARLEAARVLALEALTPEAIDRAALDILRTYATPIDSAAATV